MARTENSGCGSASRQSNWCRILLFSAGSGIPIRRTRPPRRLCEGPLIGLAQSSDPGEIEYTRLGEIIRCPWHGWEFDIRTGQSYCDPKRFRARAYPVNVEPGASVVKGPYVADTIAVSVESDYVVVDL
jgi:nitrite reductase/ring-hydroxylating ferredoxin subunit